MRRLLRWCGTDPWGHRRARGPRAGRHSNRAARLTPVLTPTGADIGGHQDPSRHSIELEMNGHERRSTCASEFANRWPGVRISQSAPRLEFTSPRGRPLQSAPGAVNFAVNLRDPADPLELLEIAFGRMGARRDGAREPWARCARKCSAHDPTGDGPVEVGQQRSFPLECGGLPPCGRLRKWSKRGASLVRSQGFSDGGRGRADDDGVEVVPGDGAESCPVRPCEVAWWPFVRCRPGRGGRRALSGRASLRARQPERAGRPAPGPERTRATRPVGLTNDQRRSWSEPDRRLSRGKGAARRHR